MKRASQSDGAKSSGFGIWEFPKIGDPSIVHEIVGSLLNGPQNKVPPIVGNPNIDLGLTLGGLLWSGVFRAFRVCRI